MNNHIIMIFLPSPVFHVLRPKKLCQIFYGIVKGQIHVIFHLSLTMILNVSEKIVIEPQT